MEPDLNPWEPTLIEQVGEFWADVRYAICCIAFVLFAISVATHYHPLAPMPGITPPPAMHRVDTPNCGIHEGIWFRNGCPDDGGHVPQRNA